MRHILAVMSLLAMAGAMTTAQEKTADGRAATTCTLKVTGMFCSACAKSVEKAAKKVDGVKTASASQPNGIAEISYDPAKTSPDAIAKMITKRTGFVAGVQEPK